MTCVFQGAPSGAIEAAMLLALRLELIKLRPRNNFLLWQSLRNEGPTKKRPDVVVACERKPEARDIIIATSLRNLRRGLPPATALRSLRVCCCRLVNETPRRASSMNASALKANRRAQGQQTEEKLYLHPFQAAVLCKQCASFSNACFRE